jgi:cation diffusion facilitator family transporter
MATTDDTLAAERRSLRVSIAGAIAFAVVGIIWGWWAESQVILLDGLYALIGLALGLLSLRAARLVEAGPTPKYPFGREALAPLMVGIQGMVLLGTFGFAAFDSVGVIMEGGSDTALGSALGYAIVSLLGAVGFWWYLKTRARESELVQAEAAQWAAGWVLSAGMFVGFGIALILQQTDWAHLAAFADPVLVLLATAVILPTPLRMIKQMYSELLEGTPGSEVAEPIQAAVVEVSAAHGLPEPTLRMGKLGRKLYLELDYLVKDEWSVGEADEVRRELMTRLDEPGRLLWINVELHSDPNWDAPVKA